MRSGRTHLALWWRWMLVGFILLLLGAILYWGFQRLWPNTIATVPVIAPYSEYSEEDRREGLHCLEEDGSHAEVVARVRAELPHPESFEHRGTALFPVRNGKHFLVMAYRSLSKDGHRMDAGVALAKIDHERCFAGEIERIS